MTMRNNTVMSYLAICFEGGLFRAPEKLKTSKYFKKQENLEEEKLKSFLKSYDKAEICKNVIVPQSNPDIW